MILTREPDFSILAQAQLGLTVKPSAGEVFRTAVSEGFHMTSIVALRDIYRLSPLATREGDERINEEAWKASPNFRPGLKWFEGITEAQAKILAERHDEHKRNMWVFQRAEGHMAALIAGSLVGGIPDPLNFIPFLGSFRALGWAARIGRTAGEAAIGATLTEPLLFAQADVFGEDHDLRMAAQNVIAATFIGAGFGALGKALSSIPEARRALATHKAAKDLIDEKPIDVGPILGEKVDGTVKPVREAVEPPEPAVTPRAKEGLEPPEPEAVTETQSRVAELEGEGRLDASDKAELAAAEKKGAKNMKLAEAEQAAAFCLTG